ncbi:MAG: hypothetical protein WAU45_14075 [Blastocatellia bacterium]
MRTCPVCGLDVEDSYLFCPDDGSRLVEAQAAAASLTAGMPAQAQAARAEAGAAHGDAVVLYCGECAAEYPMTFVECPVHHAVLRRYKIQPTAPALAITPASDAAGDQSNRSEHPDHADGAPYSVVNSGGAAQPAPYPEALATAVPEERRRPSLSLAAAPGDEPKREAKSWSPSILGVDYRAEDYAFREPGPESRFDNPSFRIVAATLVVALVLFCVVAVYIFFSGGARRRTVARAAQPISTTQVEEPPPFNPTPAEALDYKEESAVAPASAAILDSAHPDQTRKPAAERTALLAATAKAPAAVRPTPVSTNRVFDAPVEPAMTRTSITRESPSARVEQGRVDARLIRVRSMRTASGVRYDLTFDLQDESGRHAQWERMQISTRSASGVSHSQAIPFVHRLGASGALTFTVSVEMRGHSQADWQGRVVCTTTGSDNDGKPVRASFGTNVTP